MVNIKSNKKRILQSKKKNRRNVSNRSMMKTFIKKVYLSISEKNTEKTKNTFKRAQSIIDRNVNRGLIHKNKASRQKSRLIRHIKKHMVL